jgi:alkyldihydroxyacetonephosphate synthase
MKYPDYHYRFNKIRRLYFRFSYCLRGANLLSLKKGSGKKNFGKLDRIIEYLDKKIGENKVSTKKADLASYGYDYWPISLHWILEKKFRFIPYAVIWPSTGEDVKKIIQTCSREKMPVYPFGGGTGVLGALSPDKEGIIIDLKRIRDIKINNENLLVESGAGVNGHYLESYLNHKGFTLGNIPQSLYPSTVGGWIGTKATGQFSTRYGGIEQMVAGLEIVLPPGEIVTFRPHPRTATGPDLRQLFIGSEGTLGVITKTWLRIWPKPEKRIKLAFVSGSISKAIASVKAIVQSGARPAVIRIYDKIETKRHFYEYENVTGLVTTIMIIEGNSKIIEAESEIIRETFQGKQLKPDITDHWLKTRFNVKETSEFVPMGVVFDTIEVAVGWDNSVKLYENVIKAMKKVKGVIFASAHASHFYPQGICFYFTFAGITPRKEKTLDFYNKVWKAAMDSTVENKGTISHHHGIGRQRIPWMKDELGPEGLNLLRKIKRCVDEEDIMNPGNMGV